MITMKSHAWCTLFFVLLLSSCASNTTPKPEELISEDKYINLMVELQLVRTYNENAEVDSATVDSLKNKVLQEYGETIESFRASHQYYQQFPQEQKKRIEKAIERLKMDQVGQDSTDMRHRHR